MNQLQLNTAAEINRHHAAAALNAATAVSHAVEAGQLMLKAKAAIPHGEWLSWLTSYVTVTPRQAQRYIALARGKQQRIRALADANKNDTVSHLPAPVKDWEPRPSFIPLGGYWCWCAGNDGDGTGSMSYVVEPSSEHPGFFFVSHLFEDGDTYDCTARPVAAAWVESNLRLFGLAQPRLAKWQMATSDGVRVALETLNSEETTAARLTELRGYARAQIAASADLAAKG